MSRARDIILPDGEQVWFDVHCNGQAATDGQIELLTSVLDEDLDDLLDANFTQGEVIKRLREELGQGAIPPEVEERRRVWRVQRLILPACRLCGKEGDSTKHHFVPKFILRELEQYAQKWADRRKCTFPACIHCHRGLHSRDESDKSIADYLQDEEREFAQAALSAFIEEHPRMAWIVTTGDLEVYETRLMRDFIDGQFKR